MHEIEGSSSIKGIDMTNDTLRVTFVSGKCYEYVGVPPNTMVDMLAADSAGKFFATEIRPNFEGTLVDDEPDVNESDTNPGEASDGNY